MANNCINPCTCSDGNGPIPFEVSTQVNNCVSGIREEGIIVNPCLLNNCKAGYCIKEDVPVEICPDETLRCNLKFYTLTFSGDGEVTFSVPVTNGETCEVPEAYTLYDRFDIGQHVFHYCSEVCCPENGCDLIEVEITEAILDQETMQIILRGFYRFNRPNLG
ncbi:hypothetical protein [Pontibacillus yanchengensis]|uniref:Spore coat protein n=1 Tax=Pontibacillus yanchengensis Y32 TaxID=1385514 RepID=A0A0A2TFB5_9BACI|nr:hypothetical protein [Pontibacillus yanchengensis]KGP74249.1 hypothetical protein N782_09165 [Pontibacillus yanchengensis Y32]